MSAKGAVGEANLEQFKAAGNQAPAVSVAVVGFEDISALTVSLALEVGRRQITIRELLQLNAGSVVELDRSVADAFDVLVNNTLLARGETVVVNDKCGVRLTEMISAAARTGRAVGGTK